VREIVEYPFSNLDPVDSEHVDPPAVAVFETLMQRGSGGVPQPGLAAEWTVDEGGVVWRLRVRSGTRFHSGAPCDATAVVRALERCRWSDGWTRQLWYWDPVDTVRAIGDVVELRLRHPCVRLPALLWGTHTAIFNVERRWLAGRRYTSGSVDGTGPFQVVEADEHRIAARRVDSAAPTSLASPALLEWGAVPDPAERRAVIERSGADIVRGVEPDWIDDALAADWRYVEHPEISQYYLALDFDDPRGFGDLEFRRAVEAFVDRSAIVAEAFGGRGDARRSPVPVGDQLAASYDDSAARPMAVGEAEAVLDRLGWERGPTGLRSRGAQTLAIDCVVQDTDQGRRVAESLARQLRVAGIELELRPVGVFDRFYGACAERPAAFVNKWLWPDAVEAVIGFSRTDCAADSGANWQHAREPSVDRTYDRFLQASSDAEAFQRAGDVQAAFMEALPYIPLCSPTFGYAVRRTVSGYDPQPHALYPTYERLARVSQGG
jgi:ABC-type transport system substrate-binding protein